MDSAIDAIQISDFIVMRPFAQKWLIPLIRNIEVSFCEDDDPFYVLTLTKFAHHVILQNTIIHNLQLPEYFGARSIELAALLKMSPKTHDRDEFEVSYRKW